MEKTKTIDSVMFSQGELLKLITLVYLLNEDKSNNAL